MLLVQLTNKLSRAKCCRAGIPLHSTSKLTCTTKCSLGLLSGPTKIKEVSFCKLLSPAEHPRPAPSIITCKPCSKDNACNGARSNRPAFLRPSTSRDSDVSAEMPAGMQKSDYSVKLTLLPGISAVIKQVQHNKSSRAVHANNPQGCRPDM